jgi:hypothetical protein
MENFTIWRFKLEDVNVEILQHMVADDRATANYKRKGGHRDRYRIVV